MIKITAKDIADLINRTPQYTTFLLHKHGISMKKMEDIVDFISKNRMRRNCKGEWYKGHDLTIKYARKLFEDKFFKKIFEEHKKKVGRCQGCNAEKHLQIVHADNNFYNNNPSNWKVLCIGCNFEYHRKQTRNSKNRLKNLLKNKDN